VSGEQKPLGNRVELVFLTESKRLKEENNGSNVHHARFELLDGEAVLWNKCICLCGWRGKWRRAWAAGLGVVQLLDENSVFTGLRWILGRKHEQAAIATPKR
jgi:hypothetical protein